MENKREVYGVYLMNPVDCMLPKAIETLPHMTGEPVTFLTSKKDAYHFAKTFASNYEISPTRTGTGPDLNYRPKMPGVAIIYKAECPEDVYQNLTSVNLMGAHLKRGTLSGMQLHPIEAYIQGDDLHPGNAPFSVYEMGAEIASRWNDYREYQKALAHSTPEQLRAIDFNDLNAADSLRLMYGTTGRINENFFDSHVNTDHLMSIELVMYKGHVGVGYMAHLLELENQYQETYHSKTAEGYSREYAAATAALTVSKMLQNLSILYNDPQQKTSTFDKLVEVYSIEPEQPVTEQPDEQPIYPFVEPSEDEQDLFE